MERISSYEKVWQREEEKNGKEILIKDFSLWEKQLFSTSQENNYVQLESILREGGGEDEEQRNLGGEGVE